jgi:hypothetical protein
LSGCAALSQAKGYPGVLALTCILGWFPAVIIALCIPDKLRERRRRRRDGREGNSAGA